MLKMWFAKYRVRSDAVIVSSAEELHSRYADILPGLASQNPTAYRLMRVLKELTPPIHVTDAVLKQWFLRYFDADHYIAKYGLIFGGFWSMPAANGCGYISADSNTKTVLHLQPFLLTVIPKWCYSYAH